MSDFSDWMQIYWYELGTLLVQFAFLGAAVWFARKILRSMRASQEQVGALLKLSVADAAVERKSAVASPYWLTPSETSPISAPVPAQSSPGLLTSAGRSIVHWLEAPMFGGGAAPWRRVLHWLQAPAGS
jgi:hypothetical protein